MKKVTLSDGFEMEMDETRLDNMELVDAIADLIESENPLNLAKVARHMMDADARKTLYDHFRNEKGIVPSSKVSAEIVGIMRQLGAKN